MPRKPAKRPLKIAVYGICLNEEQFVDRFMDAAQGADMVIIADTGSTDGTVAAFERRGAIVHSISIKPWRFDEARNAALDLVPDDVDICVSLDLDEVIMPGWRRVLERAWLPKSTDAPKINHVMYTHEWSKEVTGLWQSHLDNRIHAREGFAWRYPCHECIMPVGGSDHVALVRHLRISHFPDPTKSRAHYLPLLEMAAEEDPQSSRHAFYLGREYVFLGRFDEAEPLFRRYLELAAELDPTLTVELGQCCAARRMIAACIAARGDEAATLDAYRTAAEAAPDVRGPQIDYAWALYQREQWQACYAAALKALAIPEAVVDYGCNSDTGVLAEDMAAICGWRLGHQQQALIFGRQALAKAPDVERIRRNVEQMEMALGASPPR